MTPAIAQRSRSATRRGRRDRCQEEHLEQQARDAGRRRTGAETELTHAYEGRHGLRLVAFPAGIGLRQARPAETTDIGLQGLDPVGQLADDGRQVVRRGAPRPASVPRRGPCSRLRSRRLPVVGHGLDRLARLRVHPLPPFVERLGLGCRRRRLRARLPRLGELAAQLLRRVGCRASRPPPRPAQVPRFARRLRRASQRPSAAMPTRPANQARARFTRTMVSRCTAVGVGDRGRRAPSGTLCGCFLPLLARAIPCPCLPVRPPKTEGRRKGNP